MDFCDNVLEHIPRATFTEREAIRRELEGHLEDRRETLLTSGMEEEQAVRRAEAAMGDPAEIGAGFNKLLSPFWLWAKRLAQCGICFLLVVSLNIANSRSGYGLTTPAVILEGVWDNLQARQGEGLEWGEGDPWNDREYEWRSDQTMRVGDDLIRLTYVELRLWPTSPGYYSAMFYFCTYNEDPFAPANGEIFFRMTLTPESGDAEGNGGLLGGWRGKSAGGRGTQETWHQLLVHEGDTYVDVTYDYFGVHATMRCPLLWEPYVSKEVEP